MDRRVIIITGGPKSPNEKEMFTTYLEHYKRFFSSNAAGSYEDDEISVLNEPTTEELNKLVDELSVHLCILVLIGHGATQDDNQLFQLNQAEIIRAGQIMIEADKKIIIMESCRSNIEHIPTVDLNDKKPLFEAGGVIQIPKDREEAKQIYIESILTCEPGLTICLACQQGEEAHNFYFSSSLLQIAFNWHSDNRISNRVLHLNELMHLTKQEVSKIALAEMNKSQNPENISIVNFPFCISKY